MLFLFLTIGISLIGGLAIFATSEENKTLRNALNIGLALVKVVVIIMMLFGVYRGEVYEVHIPILPGLDFSLQADPLALLFATLSAGLWLLTTIYAIGYLKESPNQARFFGFFAWCVSATTGIAFADNLFSFLVFYEVLTLTTFPLVVHTGSEKAIRAGFTYLAYTLFGGALILGATAWLYTITGDMEFREGGYLAPYLDTHKTQLIVIFFMLIVGFGVKVALFPFHGWLPQAMVAPAPVSALLHAVAVVKAGAFGVVRTVYDIYGIEFANSLGLLTPLAIMASITIVYGSVRAVFQDGLKKRLAFSTVSQVSYIVLGASLFGPIATIGGIVHIVHQALMKITLFFAAGNFAETLGIHKVSEMDGVGKRMPWTMTAFTIGAVGMIGMPPTVGFISKWYLAQGALHAGQNWVLGILITSAILNAIYFLPILYAGWFKEPSDAVATAKPGKTKAECSYSLLTPPIATAFLALFLGLLANMPWSPLEWATFVMNLEYSK